MLTARVGAKLTWAAVNPESGRVVLSPLPDDLIGEACLPIDLLRCKLSIFGAAKFDPKSDRWTRITLYQGAPAIAELADLDADDWAFPAFPV